MQRKATYSLLLSITVLIYACGSIEQTTIAESTPTFGSLQIQALDHTTLNIPLV